MFYRNAGLSKDGDVRSIHIAAATGAAINGGSLSADCIEGLSSNLYEAPVGRGG